MEEEVKFRNEGNNKKGKCPECGHEDYFVYFRRKFTKSKEGGL